MGPVGTISWLREAAHVSGAGALRGSADRHERVASRDAHGLRVPADVLDLVVHDQALPNSGAALPARLLEARRAVGGYPSLRVLQSNQDAWHHTHGPQPTTSARIELPFVSPDYGPSSTASSSRSI